MGIRQLVIVAAILIVSIVSVKQYLNIKWCEELWSGLAKFRAIFFDVLHLLVQSYSVIVHNSEHVRVAINERIEMAQELLYWACSTANMTS